MMFIMFVMILIILILLMLMLMINMLISKKSFKNREKMSPFECGFDPMSKNRLPFSLQFFLISIIFLIFDVEIALVLPMVLSFCYLNYYIIFTNILIMLILIFGLILEWKEGALEWFK